MKKYIHYYQVAVQYTVEFSKQDTIVTEVTARIWAQVREVTPS